MVLIQVERTLQGSWPLGLDRSSHSVPGTDLFRKIQTIIMNLRVIFSTLTILISIRDHRACARLHDPRVQQPRDLGCGWHDDQHRGHNFFHDTIAPFSARNFYQARSN